MITLREVCELIGVSRRAVQGYEAKGLVASCGKNKYGYLLYDEETIEKIRSIKLYQDFGFTIQEIKTLLSATNEIYIEMMQGRVKVMRLQLNNMRKNIELAEAMIEKNITKYYKTDC